MAARKPDKLTVVFVDPARPPRDAELRALLGNSSRGLDALLAALQRAQPTLAHAWKFSPRIGWYRVALLGERRLFYLVPRRGGFRVSLILGERAVGALLVGLHAARVRRLLTTAKRYPEGIAFAFSGAGFEPGLVLAFVQAKIAH
jgi:hypothetical protein